MKPEEKQTSNTIITQAYQSRWSPWQPSSELCQNRMRLFNPLTRQSKVKNENDAIRSRISDGFDKRRISQPKSQ